MKSATVALVGRPNVGKSTLVNTIVGQKVSITSPKPQTTRFAINAVYRDDQGELIFIDLPGLFRKTPDALSKKINKKTLTSLESDFDVLIYIVDHTRDRDFEEARVLGIVRKIDKPKILVVNKIDVKDPSFLPLYKFLEEEFDHVFYLSALKQKHIKPLIECIYSLIPETEKQIEDAKNVIPALNIDSKTFLSELIREKVFLRVRKEVPYTTTAVIDQIKERDSGNLYIKARVITINDRYKKILIGAGGRMIKSIGMMARKELEEATNKKVYLDLTVDVDKHWINTLT